MYSEADVGADADADAGAQPPYLPLTYLLTYLLVRRLTYLSYLTCLTYNILYKMTFGQSVEWMELNLSFPGWL